MRALDVVAEMLGRMVEGTMFHLQMVQYFSYLGLRGFAELHRKRFLEENTCMVDLQRFAVETTGMIPGNGQVEARSYLPNEWMDKMRETESERTLDEYVRYAMEAWKEWEEQTRNLYSRCYYALDDMREGYLADEAMRHVRETGDEMLFAYNLICWMREVDYDRLAIVQMDKDVVRKYGKYMKVVRKHEHNAK